MNVEVDPTVQRTRLLKLNVFQTWIACIVGAISIGGAVTAWAYGWIGLPQKVEKIEASQLKFEETARPLMLLTNRVQAVEDSQKAIWQKLSSDHDLLIGINQKLTDVQENQKDLSTDVKSLKK